VTPANLFETTQDAPLIGVVDDHADVRDSLAFLLGAAGYSTAQFASAEALLDAGPPTLDGLIVDVVMPGGMDGVSLIEALASRASLVPVVVVSGHGDIPLAVRAMRAGASDFVEKPYDDDSILGAVRDALARRNMPGGNEPGAQDAIARLSELSRREMDVLKGLLSGKSNKMIAIDLGISSRTVEAYRANMMDKLQVRSLPEAVRLAIAGGIRG